MPRIFIFFFCRMSSPSLHTRFWFLASSCILFVPVDVVKERLQIQSPTTTMTTTTPFYKSSYDAISTIAREEGFRGIYRGYAATLLSFGPFSALYFTFYEEVSSVSVSVLPIPWLLIQCMR